MKRLHFVICALIWTLSVLYSIYRFGVSCRKYFQNYEDYYSDFSPGWWLLARKKDVADYEWQAVKHLAAKLCPWLIFLIITSELLRQSNKQHALKLCQIFFTVVFVTKELGVYALLLILSQPAFFYFISKRRKKIEVWVCNIFVMIFLNVLKKYSSDEDAVQTFGLDERNACMLVYAMFWINLKCLSCCLDSKPVTAFDFISYCLYLPTVFSGPFISFTDFNKCSQNSDTCFSRLLQLVLDLCRFIFWLFFVEFLLHYLYVNAIGFHPEIVRNFDFWSLCGYGYTMGQFFHIKYLVLYGLASSFAKFDNITTPTLPVCIGRIHLYSDMWKYFDAGLYNFLRKCIYVPVIEIFQNRFVASLACFLFVYIWHGTESNILIWTVLNYVGVTVENLAKLFYQKLLNHCKLPKGLTEKWSGVVACILATPLLAMSAVSNFYFFANLEIGNIFISRIFSGNLSNIILFMVLYACCQVSSTLRRSKCQ